MRLALPRLRQPENRRRWKKEDARRGLEMRSVREIRRGEIMICSLERLEAPKSAAINAGRPYCVAQETSESGATVREFSSTLANVHLASENERVRAENAKLRAENSAMRSALDVIDRTLMTVRMSQS